MMSVILAYITVQPIMNAITQRVHSVVTVAFCQLRELLKDRCQLM